ncbi:hypothetical protein [Pseudobutyrivibrio sp.]
MNEKYLELWFEDGDRAFFYDREVSVDDSYERKSFFSTYNDRGLLVLDDMALLIASSGDRPTIKGDTAFNKVMTGKVIYATITNGYTDDLKGIEINENTGGSFFVDILGDLHFRLYNKNNSKETVA